MKQRAYEWDPRPPTTGERIISGIWLLAFLPAVASYYAGWRLFGGYEKWVIGALMLAFFFLYARLPGAKRVEGVRRPLYYWLLITLGVGSVIAVAVLSPSR